MVAINFSGEFARAVEDGDKRQTIRKAPCCKPGDTLQLYTGMRTGSCRPLGEARCTMVRRVEIRPTEMFLDGRRLFASLGSRDQLDPTDNEFAEADGFPGFMEMAEWFDRTYGLPFEGVVIEWELIP